jgi:CHAD domain-containing protein
MPLSARELDRRVQKLRKSLKGFSTNPAPDQVHDLRTRTRRVESILQALNLASSSNERKLLAGLKVIRKRSGKVRDMDVLTADVVGLGLQDDSDCVVRLTHHLGVQRHRHAGKLHDDVQRRASELRQRLKTAQRKLDKAVERFANSKRDLDGGDGAAGAPMHAMSEALRLSKELSEIRNLGRDNLHPYRLEVKRLRYILEIAETGGRQRNAFIQELKQVQDLIGEWHDWLELSGIARKVLKQHPDCKLVKKIEAITHKKFDQALRETEKLRRQYLQSPTAKTGPRQKRSFKPGPVLVASSEIVA